MEQELIPRANDHILCVKIGKYKRENIYEMTRKYWVLDMNKVHRITHVLAVIDGIVEYTFIPEQWSLTDDPNYRGRVEFSGIMDNDSDYIGKSVRSYYGRSANPVKYINYRVLNKSMLE